jgi:hypothetical protein
MKSVIRTVLAGGLLVFALGAVTAASASAAECPGTIEGGGVSLCSGGHEQKGTFAFTGEHKPGTAGIMFSPTTVSLKCSEPAKVVKGNLVAGSGGKLEITGLYIEYKECGVEGAESECPMRDFTVDGAEGTGSGPGLKATLTSPGEVDLVSAGTGERWMTMRVHGEACIENATYPVHGSAKCELPKSTSEAVKHVIACFLSGNKLKYGSISEPRIEWEEELEIGLTSGKAWSLQKR